MDIDVIFGIADTGRDSAGGGRKNITTYRPPVDRYFDVCGIVLGRIMPFVIFIIQVKWNVTLRHHVR